MADHISQPDPQQSPLAALSDTELLAAYLRADPDDPKAEIVLAEIQYRNLDI